MALEGSVVRVSIVRRGKVEDMGKEGNSFVCGGGKAQKFSYCFYFLSYVGSKKSMDSKNWGRDLKKAEKL